jgi:hypothetical protein
MGARCVNAWIEGSDEVVKDSGFQHRRAQTLTNLLGKSYSTFYSGNLIELT